MKIYQKNIIFIQEDLSGEDFKEMPGQLLYQLLKTKSNFPLHSAVRLQREDVVFLYLAEHNAEVSLFYHINSTAKITTTIKICPLEAIDPLQKSLSQ